MDLKLEDALKRLGEIVKILEANEVPLEEALKHFEEGIQLTRSCHGKLTEAEKKIEILTRISNGTVETKPLG